MHAHACMRACSAHAIAIVQRAINPGTYRMYSIHFGNGRHKHPKCSKLCKPMQTPISFVGRASGNSPSVGIPQKSRTSPHHGILRGRMPRGIPGSCPPRQDTPESPARRPLTPGPAHRGGTHRGQYFEGLALSKHSCTKHKHTPTYTQTVSAS